jgi:hypothetical protein
MRPPLLGTLLAALFTMVLAGVASAQSGMKVNVDMSGADYRHFDLPKPRPHLCQQACLAEEECRAWTFYRAGLLGPRAICWLKFGVPTEQPDTCCISGLK